MNIKDQTQIDFDDASRLFQEVVRTIDNGPYGDNPTVILSTLVYLVARYCSYNGLPFKDFVEIMKQPKSPKELLLMSWEDNSEKMPN